MYTYKLCVVKYMSITDNRNVDKRLPEVVKRKNKQRRS
jgi:hypothetical protein